MRLQHRGEALYRDSLQVATLWRVLSGFRKIGKFVARYTGFVQIYREPIGLGLADSTSAAIGAPAATAVF